MAIERIYTGLEQRREYLMKTDHVSQSLLKAILMGGLAGYQEYQEDLLREKRPTSKQEGLIVGTLVDAMLTSTQEELETRFRIVPDEQIPSETLVDLLQAAVSAHVARHGKPQDDQDAVETLAPSITEQLEITSWYSNLSMATRLARVQRECKDFILLLLEMGVESSAWIVRQSHWEKACRIAEDMRRNPKAGFLVDPKVEDSQRDVKIYYQYPLYGVCEGVPCKGMLDILYVEKEPSGHIKVCGMDIKTTSLRTVDFPKAAKTFRYDIQAAFYYELLRQNLQRITESPYAAQGDFSFLVGTTTGESHSLLYHGTNEFIHRGSCGDDRNVLGFRELLERYKKYEAEGFQLEVLQDESIPLL